MRLLCSSSWLFGAVELQVMGNGGQGALWQGYPAVGFQVIVGECWLALLLQSNLMGNGEPGVMWQGYPAEGRLG